MPGIYDVGCAFKGMWRKAILRRELPGSYIEGEYMPGTSEESPIDIVPQPMKPEDKLVHQSEGDINTSMLRIFTKDEVKTVDDKNQIGPDVILFKDKVYKIIDVDDWSYYGGFYTSVMEEVR